MEKKESPKIIEAREFCENTPESLRLFLLQYSESNFIILMEGLKAPEFKTYEQLKSAKSIHGKDRAYAEFNFLVYQLQTVYSI